MENDLISVLIVDDEQFIRQGLRHTILWEEFGFYILGESATAEDALEKIRNHHPDLVLLDIRMPKMHGTELMKAVRREGFQGDFIIISGYSDFKYAKAALNCGASDYLTKPIDKDELVRAILKVKERVYKRISEQSSLMQYANKAKASILHELLVSDKFDSTIHYSQLGLSSYAYQVVIYESYTPYYTTYSFADILKTANHGSQVFEHITIDNREIILLKGEVAIERFNRCLAHYRTGTEKGSPLDILFLTYSPVTPNLSSLHSSYEICCKLMDRRFFCTENQHVLSYEDLPESFHSDISLDFDLARSYSSRLTGYIQSFNRRQIEEVLSELSRKLYLCDQEINTIKYFLIDIFLQIKQTIAGNYSSLQIPFAHNAGIIETLTRKYYLYEILSYFSEQFEMIMHIIGNNSSQSVLDDILYYINHNYHESIKLDTIAGLFGYNSSYLGKIFKEKVGQNFNSYLDTVRIKNAVELLDDTDLRIYEISARVGYKSVDYFQQKFRKVMGINPSEYRAEKKGCSS